MAKKRMRSKSRSERYGGDRVPAIFEDRDNGMILPPEYKAMEAKGIPLAGKITLDQYERLVHRGYDGDVVRRWTQYHADQELRKIGHAARPTTGKLPRTTQAGVGPALHGRDPAYLNSLPVCPHCNSPVRADRLQDHIGRVHGKA